MTKKISSQQLANRRAKREDDQCSRASKIMAQALNEAFFTDVEEDNDFIVDYAGRKVRQSKPTDAEIADVLRGNRVVDQIDILENVGEKAFNNLYNNGSIKRDRNFSRYSKNNLYWITEKAAELYGIPKKFEIAGGTAKLVPAE